MILYLALLELSSASDSRTSFVLSVVSGEARAEGSLREGVEGEDGEREEEEPRREREGEGAREGGCRMRAVIRSRSWRVLLSVENESRGTVSAKRKIPRDSVEGVSGRRSLRRLEGGAESSMRRASSGVVASFLLLLIRSRDVTSTCIVRD